MHNKLSMLSYDRLNIGCVIRSSFFSSVVERGIAAMQVILRSLFRSREGAVLLLLLLLSTCPRMSLEPFTFHTHTATSGTQLNFCPWKEPAKTQSHGHFTKFSHVAIAAGVSRVRAALILALGSATTYSLIDFLSGHTFPNNEVELVVYFSMHGGWRWVGNGRFSPDRPT